MNLPPAKRVVLAVIGALAGMAIAHLVPRLLAQARATGRPAFEVASIKRNVSGSENASVRGQPGGRLTITNKSLLMLRAARARGGPPPPTTNGRPCCGMRVNAGSVVTTATTMADLARNLSPIAGRSVVDKTGLTGGYDLDLTWTPDSPAAGRANDVPDGAKPAAGDGVSLFAAVQEQLGLKLDSQRGPIEFFLAIDSAERPNED